MSDFFFSFEYCRWTHNDETCEFEWKWIGNKVVSDCISNGGSFSERISYVGNYDDHDCKIKLEKVMKSDEGKWKCEVEEYKFGSGTGAKVNGSFDLVVDNENEGNFKIILCVVLVNKLLR